MMKKIEVTENLYSMIEKLLDNYQNDYKCDWTMDEVLYCIVREEMEKRDIV